VFAYRASSGRVEIAFTDRHGGVSEGPWSSLNLGTSNGDDPDRVRANVAALAAGLGVEPRHMAWTSQVHGSSVTVVSEPPADVPVGDALVTTTPDVTLLVRGADCLPLVLADRDRGVVAVAHVGRQGLLVGAGPATVATMREQGAIHITGWLGPRICGACYEVPAGLREEVATAVPQAWSTTSWGTPALDIGAGLAAQLAADAVTVVDVAESAPVCTYENRDLFSHRRQGQPAGRLGGVVRLHA